MARIQFRSLVMKYLKQGFIKQLDLKTVENKVP